MSRIGFDTRLLHSCGRRQLARLPVGNIRIPNQCRVKWHVWGTVGRKARTTLFSHVRSSINSVFIFKLSRPLSRSNDTPWGHGRRFINFFFDRLNFQLFSNTILSNAAMATTIVGTRSADYRWSVVRATLSLTVPNRSVMAFST